MSQEPNPLVLEVSRQAQELTQSIFEQKDLASTLRQYSQLKFSPREIERLCHEATLILNKADKSGMLDAHLLRDLRKTGQLLWDMLLSRSIKERLRNTPILDLVLSLDEDLVSIPWELLYDGQEFLCLRFNLGRLVRTRQQSNPAQYRASPSKLKMLIIANPSADLKAAYAEGLYIKNRFDRIRGRLSVDFKSTQVSNLYLKKNLRDYDLVHFAGHCEYDSSDNNNSGWVLNDGKFSTRDILALGETVSLPGLVFSHACRSAQVSTGLLEADYQSKAYSLASAFLFSGVRHYLGTIRKIEDDTSINFAEEFYNQLISGKSVGSSVCLARLKLIKKYGINCVFWASYLLYGNPNFVFFRIGAQASVIKPRWKNIPLYKKRLRGALLVLPVLIIAGYLYFWLPTLKPSTYFLFLKSQKSFLKGNNEQVISLSGRIIEKDPLFLAAYPLLADTYHRLGDNEQAIKYYFDYIRCSEKKQDKKSLASAYIGTGWLYYLQGEYDKAFDFYQQALALARKNKDKLNEADVMGKLALWHMDKDDPGLALELLTKSSEINRERQHDPRHRYNLACDYFNLGVLFTNKDDLAAAEEFYEKSFRLFDKLKLRHELSDYYFNIGEIHRFRKEYAKSLDCYRKGLEIDETVGCKFNFSGDYNMIGELYLDMDNLAEAEKFFQRAVSAAKDINALPELASAYYNLGVLYRKKSGQGNRVREYLRLAQEIYRKLDMPGYQKIKEEFLVLAQE